MNPEAVAHLIGRARFQFADEKELHGGIATLLDQNGVAYRREVRLNAHDIPDFVLDLPDLRLAVEIKIAGVAGAVQRQLERYAASPGVDELLLVTTRRSHRPLGLLDRIGGKPFLMLLLRGL